MTILTFYYNFLASEYCAFSYNIFVGNGNTFPLVCFLVYKHIHRDVVVVVAVWILEQISVLWNVRLIAHAHQFHFQNQCGLM